MASSPTLKGVSATKKQMNLIELKEYINELIPFMQRLSIWCNKDHDELIKLLQDVKENNWLLDKLHRELPQVTSK